MPEYLSPGVFVEEVDRGTRPIEGVGTAMAAFVGFAPAGPSNKPVLVTNWSQYVETFSAIESGGRRNPHMPNFYMSHAVHGYFTNGGGRCYVVRVSAPPAKGAAEAEDPKVVIPSRSSNAVPTFEVKARGAIESDIEVRVEPPSQAAGGDAPADGEGGTAKSRRDAKPGPGGDGLFTLRIRMGVVEEVYENVALRPTAGGRTVAEAVNASSRVVLITEIEAPVGAPEEMAPKLDSFIIKAPQQPTRTNGIAPLPTNQPAHFIGDVAERTGVEGLQIAEDVTMVCCPDLMALYKHGGMDRDAVKSVQTQMIAHCEQMGDRMAILDPLPDLSPQDVLKWRRQETNYDSKFAALYYPWIKVPGPDGKPMEVPPCGHMAGIYARNDITRGVHKAPANEVVTGALEAVTQVTKGEQDLLNPAGVNCIRSFPGRGLRVWGARTLSSDPAWRYVNVRRLFNMIEKSIENGTQWVVFEPNDMGLWERVRRDITAFLTVCWRQGMLFGASPSQAFYVKCDEETNPQETRDLGQLIVEIGVAPVKPAEFVIFRFSQWASGGQ